MRHIATMPAYLAHIGTPSLTCTFVHGHVTTDLIQALGLSSRMLMIAGDAHMLAFDDGSNSPGGIPVFHAAALDAKPTSKGGTCVCLCIY
jgi:hypothetical protein